MHFLTRAYEPVDRARNMDNKIYSGNEGAIEISRYRNRY
jgi:hypothetical protein